MYCIMLGAGSKLLCYLSILTFSHSYRITTFLKLTIAVLSKHKISVQSNNHNLSTE